MITGKTADEFFAKDLKYSKELNELRRILLKTGLEETIKWGVPCYCFGKHHVVGTCEFKSYFGLWFHQGALLKDPEKKLINANEANTKALRQWRMNSIEEINENEILAYVHESIENIKIGNTIAPQKDKPIIIPGELVLALSKNLNTKNNFDQLNKTKKREFCEYIETAKRAETKQQRLEKIIPMIMDGIGLNDKYRK